MNKFLKTAINRSAIKSIAACALFIWAGNTFALDVFLRTGTYVKTLPDNATVTMWGYAQDTSATAADGVLSSPGPVITVPAADTALNIILINGLGVPTSLVVPGQNIEMVPVFSKSDGSVCTFGPADRDCRVRSFAKEAAPGTSNTVYSYTSVKPGTFLYQSGTTPQIQVQMGLYGALKHDAPLVGSVKNAYAGVAYDQDLVLLYSEIDKAMHDQIDAGGGALASSTLNYDPKYFLVNGQSYSSATPPPITELGAAAVNGVLIRLLNAGLRTRVPTFSNGHWFAIAEDGNPYRNSKEQYTAFLPAGKTTDVWFAPIASRSNAAVTSTFTVFDRRLGLSNNNADTAGGMLTKFSVKYDAGNLRLGPYAPLGATQGVATTFNPSWIGGAPTVSVTFALEVAPLGMTINPTTGVLSWIPTNEQAARPAAPAMSNPVTVRATDINGRFDRRSWTAVVVNTPDAPVTVPDTFDVYGAFLNQPAAGVMRKAVDPDGDAISGLVVTRPVGFQGTLNVAPSGAFTYTATLASVPATGFTTQQFTYTVSDGALTSNPGTITLKIHANRPPVANNDRYSFVFTGVPTTRTLGNVAANDADADGTVDITTVTLVDLPNNGGRVVWVPGINRFQYKARVGFKGTETFTYTIKDNLGGVSNKAYVQVDTR
jgi:Bacterial Ig domain